MELMDVADIALALKVSHSRIYQLIQRGELPCVRLGGRIRVPRATWESFWENKGREALQAALIPAKDAEHS